MIDIETIQSIVENKVCAIVRGTTSDKMDKIADSLLAGGVNVIEVTFNTPGASDMITELSQKYGDRLLIGAGTVLDAETAKTAIDAGAKFVLSPTLNIEVLRICQRYNVVPIPGVLTPTEALIAWENGAKIIKVFPSGILGANYIKQLKGPLSQIEIMAVGGVNADNISDFFKAGACSVGIGGELVNAKLVEKDQFHEITIRAKKFVNMAKLYKELI